VYIAYFRNKGLATPAGDARTGWYVATPAPRAVFSGRLVDQVTERDSFYSFFSGEAVRSRADSTPFEMWMDTLTTAIAPPALRIGVHINPTDSVVDEMRNLFLVAVVYEDSFGAPGLHGDTIFAPIARAVVTDTWGVPLSLRFGSEFDTTLETTLGEWETSRLGVAAFVQDTSTKDILQATVIRRIRQQKVEDRQRQLTLEVRK